MGKLNTDVSIVDYLKSKNQDSSYTARKKLAEKYGISNYSGLGEQNTQLLQKLKGGTSTPTAKKETNTPQGVSVGVGKLVNVEKPKATVPYAVSATPTAKPTTQPTQQPTRVQPVAPTFDYKPQAPTYTGSYDQQIASLYQNIMNTGSFNYDMNNDLLYKQYKDAYTKQADMSMRDTMGNAASLTGGYGSSYAGTVGQQAYNAQMDNLNNIVPQLADRAYGIYKDDLTSKYNQLSATQQLSDNEYQKYLDSYNQWSANRDTSYNQYLGSLNQYNQENEFEYNKGVDDRNYQYQVGRDKVTDQQYKNEFAYQQQRDKIGDSQWNTQFNYNKTQDAISNSRSASKSSASAAEEKGDPYAKGTKLYAERKSSLSSDMEKMMSQTNEFGERAYTNDYIAEWVLNMAENADMAEELMRAYGIYDSWYKKNYGTTNKSSSVTPLQAKKFDEILTYMGNKR